jgi:hypothetical protein
MTLTLPEKLHIEIGSRVMLLKNIEARYGLLNVPHGTVTIFQWSHERNTTITSEIPYALLVLFHNPNVSDVLQENKNRTNSY